MPAQQGSGDIAAQLDALARPEVESVGAELLETEVKGEGSRRVVRLIVDREGGVDVEALAQLSRTVGARFDDANAINTHYTLQVTSPGLDRPLRSARDFARNVGRTVRVRVGDGEVAGVVVAADDTLLTLDDGAGEVRLALDEVEAGRVVLPW